MAVIPLASVADWRRLLAVLEPFAAPGGTSAPMQELSPHRVMEGRTRLAVSHPSFGQREQIADIARRFANLLDAVELAGFDIVSLRLEFVHSTPTWPVDDPTARPHRDWCGVAHWSVQPGRGVAPNAG